MRIAFLILAMADWMMIFYYKADTLDNRNRIADKLKAFGFEWVEMVNGQAGFAAEGDFRIFCNIVMDAADEHGIHVSRLMACPHPGVGLFAPEDEP